MHSKQLTLLAAVAVIFFNTPALAQEAAPGDACTAAETDYIKQVGGPETAGVVHIMRCDGANWQQYMTFLASGKVGIGTGAPDAVLDLSSTTSGMLPPRMTTIQRNAIVTPVAGMFIYNTDTNKNEYYNGTTWASLSSGSSVLTAISDTDGDTKVQVEESPNENVIRFDAGATENILRLDSGSATIQFLSGSANPNGLAIVNLAGSLGSGAGITMRTASTVQAARLGSTREPGPNDSGLKFETANNGVLNEHMRIDSNGNVGIKTSLPAATLDINGFARLATNSSAPAACAAGIAGSIALTSSHRLCVCNGASWNEVNSATVCSW